MTQQLTAKSSQKVQTFLSQHGKSFVVKEMPESTRTAQEAAQAIGCQQAQIAKSLIFKDANSDDPILLIVSGTNQVCTDKVEEATGLKLTKADAWFVRDRIGYAIGGVPPIAHNEDVKTILDPDLKQYPSIWAAAGTPNAVFELEAADLPQLTQGMWVELAK